MNFKKLGSIVTSVAALTVSLLPGTIQAQTPDQPQLPKPQENYGQYSLMFEKSAGQFWADGGKFKNQWAWEPQDNNVSLIRWGDPENWPPKNYEKFQKVMAKGEDGKLEPWVVLHGFGNDQGMLKQIVDEEYIGTPTQDNKCTNLKALPKYKDKDGDALQHYVKWNIPKEGYCLVAKGRIDLPNTPNEKDVHFKHTQIWSAPEKCSNQYHKDKKCIKQHEIWEDNQDNETGKVVGGPNDLKVDIIRTNSIAKDMGPAFKIVNEQPNKGWTAELFDSWNYGDAKKVNEDQPK